MQFSIVSSKSSVNWKGGQRYVLKLVQSFAMAMNVPHFMQFLWRTEYYGPCPQLLQFVNIENIFVILRKDEKWLFLKCCQSATTCDSDLRYVEYLSIIYWIFELNGFQVAIQKCIIIWASHVSAHTLCYNIKYTSQWTMKYSESTIFEVSYFWLVNAYSNNSKTVITLCFQKT